MATIPTDETIHVPIAESVEHKFQYPGIPTTCDGAEAVVWVETHICQGSGAFPITSSTTMGGGFNQAVMNGKKNLWGDLLVFSEPESEHSSATFLRGICRCRWSSDKLHIGPGIGLDEGGALHDFRQAIGDGLQYRRAGIDQP